MYQNDLQLNNNTKFLTNPAISKRGFLSTVEILVTCLVLLLSILIPTWLFCLGAPLDLMARRVLAAGSKEIAREVSQYLECIELPRD